MTEPGTMDAGPAKAEAADRAWWLALSQEAAATGREVRVGVGSAFISSLAGLSSFFGSISASTGLASTDASPSIFSRVYHWRCPCFL